MQVDIRFRIPFGRLTRHLLEELQISDTLVPRISATNEEERYNIDVRKRFWIEVTEKLKKFGVKFEQSASLTEY